MMTLQRYTNLEKPYYKNPNEYVDSFNHMRSGLDAVIVIINIIFSLIF
jgi:hypothetical protein